MSHIDPRYCRDFLHGSCGRANCRYEHATVAELMTRGEDVGRLIFCRDFQRSNCYRPAGSCRFIHGSAYDEVFYRANKRLPDHLLGNLPTSISLTLLYPLHQESEQQLVVASSQYNPAIQMADPSMMNNVNLALLPPPPPLLPPPAAQGPAGVAAATVTSSAMLQGQIMTSYPTLAGLPPGNFNQAGPSQVLGHPIMTASVAVNTPSLLQQLPNHVPQHHTLQSLPLTIPQQQFQSMQHGQNATNSFSGVPVQFATRLPGPGYVSVPGQQSPLAGLQPLPDVPPHSVAYGSFHHQPARLLVRARLPAPHSSARKGTHSTSAPLHAPVSGIVPEPGSDHTANTPLPSSHITEIADTDDGSPSSEHGKPQHCKETRSPAFQQNTSGSLRDVSDAFEKLGLSDNGKTVPIVEKRKSTGLLIGSM